MRRLLGILLIVFCVSGVAEARTRPTHTAAQHGRVIHPIPHQPKKTFVGWLVNEFVWPAVRGAATTAVSAVVVGAL